MPITILLTSLLWLAAGFTCLFSLLGFLSHLDWKLELFSHFRVQYALLSGACAVGFLIIASLGGTLISLACLGTNLALILPIYRRRKRQAGNRRTIRLFFANILGTNTHYEQLLMAIHKSDADIVLLVEVRANHMERLLPALSSYPNRFAQPHIKNYGIAIFSRLPLESVQALAFDERCTPALVARLSVEDTPLTLVGIHAYPPKSKAQADRRNHQLAMTASFIRTQPGELILAGDFNCTSWSHAFGQLIRHSQLLDSRQGFGLQPSWPAGNPLLRIPIDHVLHTPGIRIQTRKLGLPTGSDHLPIVIDFSIPSKASAPKKE